MEKKAVDGYFLQEVNSKHITFWGNTIEGGSYSINISVSNFVNLYRRLYDYLPLSEWNAFQELLWRAIKDAPTKAGDS